MASPFKEKGKVSNFQKNRRGKKHPFVKESQDHSQGFFCRENLLGVLGLQKIPAAKCSTLHHIIGDELPGDHRKLSNR